MRPQHITAENMARGCRWDDMIISFNEAAAYHCGKPARPTSRSGGAHSFNEAAAYHCGKPVGRRSTARRR